MANGFHPVLAAIRWGEACDAAHHDPLADAAAGHLVTDTAARRRLLECLSPMQRLTLVADQLAALEQDLAIEKNRAARAEARELTLRALRDAVDELVSEDATFEAISGQICRCTGYTTIVRSVQWAAEHGAHTDAETVGSES